MASRGGNDRKVRKWFRTRSQVTRYLGGAAITCLLCGQKFQRLGSHLAYKHGLRAEEYKDRYGLPRARGLTSKKSRGKSGWSKARRVKARRLAHRSKFYKLAHSGSERKIAPYAFDIFVANLGERARGFGSRFERKVHTLFNDGLIDREIAAALGVNRGTVNRLTRRWRKVKPHAGKRKRQPT
jgi:DNA invertase Pin-like site-specific DNA recombinase